MVVLAWGDVAHAVVHKLCGELKPLQSVAKHLFGHSNSYFCFCGSVKERLVQECALDEHIWCYVLVGAACKLHGGVLA